MSVSRYKKWMTEAFINEAGIDRDSEKKDQEADKVAREDGDTWMSPSGQYGGKYKGKIQYFDSEDSAGEYAKSGTSDTGNGEKEEPKAEPKKTAISKTGGLGGDEKPSGEPEGDSDSEHVSKIQSVRDSDEIETLLSKDSDFRDGYEAIEDEDSGYKDDYGKDLTIDDLHFKIKMIDAGEDPEDFLGDFNDEDELVDAWKDSVGKAMAGKQGRTGTEEIKVINGKKYRAIKESVDKRITVKEIKSWLKGLEEYRYRKIPGVDARRITSFINNGLNETDLPISLQKKWEHAKYSKEKGLADRFIKQRISQKLTQTESKHPIKENYDRLFAQTNESDFIDEGIIDDLLKKIVAKISSSDQKTVKQLSKRDPKFAKAYKQFVKARSDLESSLRTNKGFYASI